MALRRLNDQKNELWLSVAVVCEVEVKRSIGKLKLPDRWLKIALERGMTPLPVELEHAKLIGDLPLHHRDPFDRMLIAQAKHERAAIVSADAAFANYDVRVIW